MGGDEGQGDYAARLAQSMKSAGVDVNGLAKHLGVTPNAIKKVLARGSTSLSATNNARAAKHLGVSSDWLATGDGPMRSGWPFLRITSEQIAKLSDIDRLLIEGHLMQAMHSLSEHEPGELPAGVVVIPERRRGPARRHKGGIKTIRGTTKPATKKTG